MESGDIVLRIIKRKLVLGIVFAIAFAATAPRVCARVASPGPGITEKEAEPKTADSSASNPLPTVEESQQRITVITDDSSIPPEIKTPLLESMNRLTETLKQIADANSRRKKLEEQVAAVPVDLRQAKQELEQTPPTPRAISTHQPLDQVRARKGEKDAELTAVKTRRAELQAKEENRKTRRSQATELIASLRTELQKLEAETPPADPENKMDPRLLWSVRRERTAKIEVTRAWLALQQQTQRAIEAEEELLPLQILLADREVSRLEKEVALLTQAVSNRREIKVEETLQEHRKALVADSMNPDNSVVLQLGKAWIELVKKHGEAEREKTAAALRAEKLAGELTSTSEAIRSDIENNGVLRSGLGLKLQRQRSKLPLASSLRAEIRAVDSRIEEMGSLQAQLEMLIDDLDGNGLSRNRYAMPPDDPAVEREIARLQQMNRDIDNYTTDLIEIENHLEQLRKTAEDFRHEIDANVLWIRNLRPYSLREFSLAWHSFKWIMAPENLAHLGSAIAHDVAVRPDIAFLWLLVTGGLFWSGAKFRRAIRDLGEKAAKRNQTAMRPTLRVLWMSGVLCLPLVFLLAIPGWRLSEASDGSIYVRAVGQALLLIAVVVFPIEMARQLVRSSGLAVMHLGFRESSASAVRGALRMSIDYGMPIILFWGIAYNSDNVSINSSLARPLFLCGMALLAIVLWRVLHPSDGLLSHLIVNHPGGWLDRLRYVWHPGLSGLPLILGMLTMAGYSYSARQLAEQLYWTLWLVLALVVIGGAMRRWVTISRRRLLLAQARQRASEVERREGTPADLIIESSGPDLTEINAQTLRLINALLTVMTVVGLSYMWAPVLPAVRFFDTWELWDGVDSDGKTVPVTLANLLSSLPVILLTFVSVRNVPGLLENVLLQKLPLENAVRYAITTLSRYLMLLVGCVLSANTLGLRWESIQWLVAALGVGLGFGLQEIFANFISGIILLFEQPIRVGDVVTIDGTTGAVSRIRMRATTVTNWDRQELIIPNKDLITGRLINWTLSDSTNRLVINVGVAYGSDTRKACQLLEQIGKDHINVVDDPVPVVTFEGFGDSTLNLVMRCYLKTLDVRLKTIHELHTEINERFSKAGVEIAFPQRDLHIRSFPAGFKAVVEESSESNQQATEPQAEKRAA
jgi:potassium efflux system protein